jgi:release factor glutamine methyltransferase
MVHNNAMPDKSLRPTIRETIDLAAPDLKPRRITCEADRDLGTLEAEILLAHVLKKDRTWLRVHDTERVSSRSERLFTSLVARRKQREPIAYILGEKEFYGIPFSVNRHVLIPRPESELIVDRVREILKREPSSHDLVLDIGTGSGAIALAIAQYIQPRAVIATDVSADALRIAKRNAARLKLKNVRWLKANLLDASLRSLLDRQTCTRLVITANLPYLPLSDRNKLEKDVVAFEPSSALFAKNYGLELIEQLLRQLASFDIHFHTLLLEYDPPQTKTLRALARSVFPKHRLQIHKDLAGRNRVLEITQSL